MSLEGGLLVRVGLGVPGGWSAGQGGDWVSLEGGLLVRMGAGCPRRVVCLFCNQKSSLPSTGGTSISVIPGEQPRPH